MPANYGKWTIPQLHQELRLRGARIEGRKQELVDRLEAYDRNRNFRRDPVVLPPAPSMPEGPPIKEYRTVTQDHKDEMPQVRYKVEYSPRQSVR